MALLFVHYVASIGYMHFISKHEAAQMGLYRQTTADLLIQQRLRDLEQLQLEEDHRQTETHKERWPAGQPSEPRKTTPLTKKETRRQTASWGHAKDEL